MDSKPLIPIPLAEGDLSYNLAVLHICILVSTRWIRHTNTNQCIACALVHLSRDEFYSLAETRKAHVIAVLQIVHHLHQSNPAHHDHRQEHDNHHHHDNQG